jgi:hypothetical protein
MCDRCATCQFRKYGPIYCCGVCAQTFGQQHDQFCLRLAPLHPNPVVPPSVRNVSSTPARTPDASWGRRDDSIFTTIQSSPSSSPSSSSRVSSCTSSSCQPQTQRIVIEVRRTNEPDPIVHKPPVTRQENSLVMIPGFGFGILQVTTRTHICDHCNKKAKMSLSGESLGYCCILCKMTKGRTICHNSDCEH